MSAITMRAMLVVVLGLVARGVSAHTCDSDIPEPVVPAQVPSWALGVSADALEADSSVLQLEDADGNDSGTFVNGSEMVIKTCDAASVHAAVDYSAPSWKGDKDPQWDIYFDCGAGSHIVVAERTLVFGLGAKTLYGRYRLIATDGNVELNGNKKLRIMLVHENAEMLVSGITFKHGKQVGWGKDYDKLPLPGGYNGAAILVGTSVKLVVHRCSFLNNKSLSYFYSRGQGAGIHLGLYATGIIWGCHFDSNLATTGAAVSAVTVRKLHIAQSTFYRNKVRGGIFPGAIDKGYDKPLIIARGAALRVDSIRPHTDGSTVPHVYLCGNEFKQNAVKFKTGYFSKLGYENDDWEYLRASGSALWVFNKAGNMDLAAGDKNFATIRDCHFKWNTQSVDGAGEEFAREVLGAYVLEAEGAGDITLSNLVFKNNSVLRALMRLMQVKPSDTSILPYFTLTMSDLSFKDNDGADSVYFIKSTGSTSSTCEIKAVDGVTDGDYDCFA